MRGQRLVKEIISKDLQDEDLYVKIPTIKMLELIKDKITLAKHTNGEVDDFLLPIKSLYVDSDNDIILYLETNAFDNMPF